VSAWEYRKIDLNQQHPRGDELDMLNAAGEEGWELVGITSNNIAYLKREFEEPALDTCTASASVVTPADADAEWQERSREVKVKYRESCDQRDVVRARPDGQLA